MSVRKPGFWARLFGSKAQAPSVESTREQQDQVIRSMSEEDCARQREQFLDTHVIPAIEAAFAEMPGIKSAALLVAQYWCDEAVDAVHCHILYSIQDTPDIDGWAKRNIQAWEGADNDDEWDRYLNFADPYDQAPKVGVPDVDKVMSKHAWISDWDENYQAIPLFAAWCHEETSQEDAYGTNYVPFATFTRTDMGQAQMKIIGKMHRPWLEGVVPQD